MRTECWIFFFYSTLLSITHLMKRITFFSCKNAWLQTAVQKPSSHYNNSVALITHLSFEETLLLLDWSYGRRGRWPALTWGLRWRLDFQNGYALTFHYPPRMLCLLLIPLFQILEGEISRVSTMCWHLPYYSIPYLSVVLVSLY